MNTFLTMIFGILIGLVLGGMLIRHLHRKLLHMAFDQFTVRRFVDDGGVLHHTLYIEEYSITDPGFYNAITRLAEVLGVPIEEYDPDESMRSEEARTFQPSQAEPRLHVVDPQDEEDEA